MLLASSNVFVTTDTVGLGTSEVLHRAGIKNLVEPDASIYLLAGSESGQLSMWELESGGTCRAVNQAGDFHLSRVAHLFCIPSGEAAGALVSNGADNCVKVSLNREQLLIEVFSGCFL